MKAVDTQPRASILFSFDPPHVHTHAHRLAELIIKTTNFLYTAKTETLAVTCANWHDLRLWQGNFRFYFVSFFFLFFIGRKEISIFGERVESLE